MIMLCMESLSTGLSSLSELTNSCSGLLGSSLCPARLEFDPETIDLLLESFFLMLCLLGLFETTMIDVPTEVPRLDSTPLLERCE